MNGHAPNGQGQPPGQPPPTVPPVGAPAPPPAKKTPPIVFVALGLAVVLTTGIAFVGIMLVRSAGESPAPAPSSPARPRPWRP